LQRQVEKALEFSHWLVPNVIKQSVYVLGWDAVNPKTGKPRENASNAWLGLSPDHQGKNVADVGKLGPVFVRFRPTLATNQQAMAMIAMQLTNAEKPLSSQRHAAEVWLQEEDWETIADQIEVEEALREEPLRTLVREEALREAGLLPKLTQPNPAAQLVDQYGNQMLPQGPNTLGPVPLANQAPPGVPGVPGLTMPVQPSGPSGGSVPGATGGRPAGMYPGQPGGPNMR